MSELLKTNEELYSEIQKEALHNPILHKVYKGYRYLAGYNASKETLEKFLLVSVLELAKENDSLTLELVTVYHKTGLPKT